MLVGDIGMTADWWRVDADNTPQTLRFAIIATALTLAVASSPAWANGGTIGRSAPIPAELMTGAVYFK